MSAKPPSVRHIVVGLDGSPHAAAALGWAIAIAKGMGSEVVAVYAIDIPVDLSGGLAPLPPLQADPEWRDSMTRAFEEEWCQPLRESGVGFRTVVGDGRPASVIGQVADDADADVVVIGRRGLGAVAELLLGSVSHELALHCSRPILLIPH